jgi:segregation and condensation protein B
MSDVIDSVYALLFVADAPVEAGQLAVGLGLTEGQIEQALEVLRDRLQESGPIQLVRIAGGYQLATKPELQNLISEFLKPRRQKMSRGLLEVLAVVAYRQPITVAEVDAVRGVQSDYAVRALVERRLIQEVGRRQALGRPILYGTTRQFLHAFGMNGLEELPAVDKELTLPAQDKAALAQIVSAY